MKKALHYVLNIFYIFKVGGGSEKLKQVWLFARLALPLSPLTKNQISSYG